jgi:hypothetical protein
MLLTVGLLCSVLASSLSSCVVAHGSGTSWTYAGLGADADGLAINAGGMTVKKLNTSPAFIEVTKLVSKMWNAYLVQQGLQYIGGKYYDHQNAVVSSNQTVKLEELRNAKSIADANAKLEELKLTTAVAPAQAP